MIDKSFRSSSVSVSVAVKHYTRPEGVNYEAVCIKHYVCVCVCLCLFLSYPEGKLQHFYAEL